MELASAAVRLMCTLLEGPPQYVMHEHMMRVVDIASLRTHVVRSCVRARLRGLLRRLCAPSLPWARSRRRRLCVFV